MSDQVSPDFIALLSLVCRRVDQAMIQQLGKGHGLDVAAGSDDYVAGGYPPGGFCIDNDPANVVDADFE